LFSTGYPSIVGPNNYPPIEAASLGCPVLLSDIPGHREQMQDAALFFDKFSPIDLADKIMILHNEKDLRMDLIKKGKELVRDLTMSDYFKSLGKIFLEFKKYRKLWGEKYLPK